MKTGRKISELQSLFSDIEQARRDCASAIDAYISSKWTNVDMWIGSAMLQLESARAKLKRHTGTRKGGGVKRKCKTCVSYYPHHFRRLGVCGLIGRKVRGNTSGRPCWKRKRRAK